MPLKRYVIERDVPGVGKADAAGYANIAKTSNAALNRLGPKVHWEHSYVTGDKTFCVYLAEDEAAIREHARLAGFPANTITPVAMVLDPSHER
jgi:hypothetical protein